MSMSIPSTSASTPHLSKTFETGTLDSAGLRRSSSGNQLYPTMTGAGQPTSPYPTSGTEAIQNDPAYEYTDFPWTSEPQNVLSSPESMPRLSRSRTFETDNKSTRGNRLLKASKSTLTGAGQPGSPDGSGYAYAGFPRTTEPQNISTTTPPTQPRPHPPRRFSKYAAMLLAVDDISLIHGIFIKFFVWILLAGFLVLPATFKKLEDNQDATGKQNTTSTIEQNTTSNVKSAVIGQLYHLPFFVVGFACAGIGVLGMCWFWYRWQSNYIWICQNIFMPGALSALQGVIATLSSNYGANNKLVFAGSSKWTLLVTGGITVVCGVLFVIYKFIVLKNVQANHDEEYGKREAGRRGEGIGFEHKDRTV